MIKASRSLGIIPMSHFPINWVPIDLASSAITELVVSPPTESIEVYNIVNPREVSWSLLADELQTGFGPGHKIAPLDEWAEAAGKNTTLVADDTMLEAAVKLVGEMVKLPRDIKYGTGKAMAASPTMASMKAIDAKLLGRWLEQWKF